MVRSVRMLDNCTLAWNTRTVDPDVGATKLEPPTSRVEDLRQKVGCEWPSISEAKQRTTAHLEKIRSALAKDENLTPRTGALLHLDPLHEMSARPAAISTGPSLSTAVPTLNI